MSNENDEVPMSVMPFTKLNDILKPLAHEGVLGAAKRIKQNLADSDLKVVQQKLLLEELSAILGVQDGEEIREKANQVVGLVYELTLKGKALEASMKKNTADEDLLDYHTKTFGEVLNDIYLKLNEINNPAPATEYEHPDADPVLNSQSTFADLQSSAFASARDNGWFCSAENSDNEFPVLASSLHAEISEAWEMFRVGYDPHEPTMDFGPDGSPTGIPFELADIVLRIMSYCEYNEIE